MRSNGLKIAQLIGFWGFPIIIALASVRFIFLGWEAAFPNMIHQMVADNYLFQIHVIASPIALFIAPFQMSKRFRNSSIRRHRLLGRLYMICILLGGLTGIGIGYSVTQGTSTQIGFMLLGLVWLIATFKAYQSIRAGDVVSHQRWMIRSFALTFAAVTLRLQIPSSLAFGLPFDEAYKIIAWACWVPNLIVAEWYLRLKQIGEV